MYTFILKKVEDLYWYNTAHKYFMLATIKTDGEVFLILSLKGVNFIEIYGYDMGYFVQLSHTKSL